MYGALLGDIIGAPYEFDRGSKTKEFPLFSEESKFTDDSVMTIAVAEALMDSMGEDDETVKAALVKSMVKWGRKYPNAGYGAKFYWWLKEENPQPYGSFGNGSAMRVSSVGWLYDTLEETRHAARLTAEVSHNHPEGIKGAEAIASAIFMARTGSTKEEIKEYIIREFGYDLSRTCDEIRPDYYHVETCQKTVPEAITAFMEGNDFEDVVRTAVSLGGDCDTLTDIAASMAEAFYGIPEEILKEGKKRLPKDMLAVAERFRNILRNRDESFKDPFLEGNEKIEIAVSEYFAAPGGETLSNVLETIRSRMNENGHFMIPVIMDKDSEDKTESFAFRTVQTEDGKQWYALFTSKEEFEKGPKSEVLSFFMDRVLQNVKDDSEEGIIINPWGQSFLLSKDLIQQIFQANDEDPDSLVGKKLKESDLEDGSLLKKAIRVFNEDRSLPKLVLVLQLLRDSYVYVPCTADTNNENVRLIPDILQNGEDFYFPVFTSREEMGEYGNHFSTVCEHILDVLTMAEENEKNVAGLVINAFSEPCEIVKELFDRIREMESQLDTEQITS